MHPSNQSYLFRDRRFLPFFITQFCGGFNDCLLKNSLIILITYKLSSALTIPAEILIVIINALFISPFIFFASLAGQIADRFERSTLIKLIKVVEVGLILLALHGFREQSAFILCFTIFLMGVHSTFFGPLKYAILPDHLAKHEILNATAYVEGGTFLSILIGTMGGSLYVGNPQLIGNILLITALIGVVSSALIPLSNNSNKEVKISYNFWQDNIKIMKYCQDQKMIYLAIIGASWFWFIGASFLAQLPVLAKNILGADEGVTNLFLAMFSLGVGIGSLVCNKLLDNEISSRYVFMSALGIGIAGIDLFFTTQSCAFTCDVLHLENIWTFLAKPRHWRILADLFFLSCFSGIFVVPLYAIIQYLTPKDFRSRVISANNLYNSLFMVASTVILGMVFSLGFSIPQAILLISIMNIVVAVIAYRSLPESTIIPDALLRAVLKFILDKLYGVQVRGLEHLQQTGQRVVIIANHISYLDAILLATYIPVNLTFAINKVVAEYFWVKPFLKLVKSYPLDSSNPIAIKNLINELKNNKPIAIFPEGRISLTGSLMKIYEGPGMIADKADAMILPVCIDGAQYSPFSKLKNSITSRLFPRIIISIMPPVKLVPPAELDNRERRKYIGEKLYDIMSEMLFKSATCDHTLFEGLLQAAKLHGYNREIIQDYNQNSLTYRQLLTKAFALGKYLSKVNEPGEYLGLMLPSVATTVVSFYAMQAAGVIPCMINFTSGSRNILLGLKAAKVRVVYTSRQFVETAELTDLIEELNKEVKIIYLEDLRAKISLENKIEGFFGGLFPNLYYNIIKNQSYVDTAVVLFTSGTEGVPKGVALSHKNISANVAQLMTKFDFNINDCAFNALPLFHSFGLVGLIVMLANGARSFLYPSPLHYKTIPEIIYDISATIIFSTDTFLRNYAKYAHSYDFYSLRYVLSGAEKLKTETRNLWLDKFGIRILEGYGATEAAPVISVNTPMHNSPGSVGRLMPGIDYMLKPVEGLELGQKLYIKGPNVMIGYFSISAPGVAMFPADSDGWYDTGDVVTIDDKGYIKIVDRVKRFAKIAGEMISLTLIEQIANGMDAAAGNAAVCLAEENRGEQIILLTTSPHVNKETLLAKLKSEKLTEICCPKSIILVESIPVFATGKTNYQQANAIAAEAIAQASSSVVAPTDQ